MTPWELATNGIDFRQPVSPLIRHAIEVRYDWYVAHAAQHRWEDAHGGHGRYAWIDEAICQWCGETVERAIEYNPRHADSLQQAIAICHGLVEYHLINGGCKRGREEGQLGA